MRSLLKDIRSHRPLLIEPSLAQSFLERCASMVLPLGAKASDIGDMLVAYFGATPALKKSPPYAIIPIRGVIGKNLSAVEALCGGCDLATVAEMLEECEQDASIATIIFDVDSPGGTSVGVPELAKRIRQCKKKTIAYTEADCCSAAYWLASQASEFAATPSSSIGSIGCYIVFENMKAAYASEGIVVDVIKAGALKGTGITGTDLNADQRAMLQTEVDEIHKNFVSDVLLVREFASEADMDGRSFSGTAAAQNGLVTSIVDGFDELLASLGATDDVHIEADTAPAEEADEGDAGMSSMASARALGGAKGLSAALQKSRAAKTPDDEEKDGVEATPKKSIESDDDKKDDEKSDESDDDKKDESDEARCVISDFDGTIRCEDGGVDEDIADHLAKMTADGKLVHIVTERDESQRDETASYLDDNGIKYDALHMQESDTPADQTAAEYKVGTAKRIEEESGKISHIIEDDEDCSDALTAAGFKCLHPSTLNAAADEADGAEKTIETDTDADKSESSQHKSRGIA